MQSETVTFLKLRTGRRAFSAGNDDTPFIRIDRYYDMFLVTMIACWLSVCAGCDRSLDSAPAPSASQPALGASVYQDRSIRVLLLDEIFVAEVDVPDDCDLMDPDSGERLVESVPHSTMTVTFGEASIRFPRLHISAPLSVVDLVPRGEDPVGLRLDDEVRYFRGRLRFLCRPDNVGAVINVVDIEDYLAAVVSAELDRRFHQETFRAQAIVARTYAWYHIQTASDKQPWDVTAKESSQVYPGLARLKKVPQAAGAVHDTRGLVCTWDSPEGQRIFCTYYSSVCGGWTQSAEAIRKNAMIPPLRGNVRCKYCDDAPNFYWGPVEISKTEVTKLLRERYANFEAMGMIDRIEVTQATPAGRPVRLTLSDAEGQSLELEAENFRLALDPTGRTIRSTFFELVDQSGQIVFQSGRGFGHGVGLCQYGAEGLARRGVKANSILRFYYPGMKLRRAY